MWDTRAVDLRLNLPRSVAAEVEAVQREDPEMLSRWVTYAVARRTIYQHLSSREEGSGRPVLTDDGDRS